MGRRLRGAGAAARAALAGALLCAASAAGAAPEAAAPAADAGRAAMIDLGPLAFSVEGAWRVTHVVAGLAARFADADAAGPHRDPGGIVRLRDAALGAVRDAPPGGAAGTVDLSAIERRLLRAMAARAPGLEEVRLRPLGTRTEDRR